MTTLPATSQLLSHQESARLTQALAQVHINSLPKQEKLRLTMTSRGKTVLKLFINLVSIKKIS